MTTSDVLGFTAHSSRQHPTTGARVPAAGVANLPRLTQHRIHQLCRLPAAATNHEVGCRASASYLRRFERAPFAGTIFSARSARQSTPTAVAASPAWLRTEHFTRAAAVPWAERTDLASVFDCIRVV